MKNTLKRLTALILSMAMALSLLCGSAWAAELDPADTGGEPAAESSAEEAVEAEAPAPEEPEETEMAVAETEALEETAVEAEAEESGEIQALSTVASGKCGNDVRWVLDSNGTLTISGTGKMYDYGEEGPFQHTSGPWDASKVKSVVVKSGVTSIGNCAFAYSRLTSVTLEEGLQRIEENAFIDTGLTNITIPKSVTYIGGWAIGYEGLDAFCDAVDGFTIYGYTGTAAEKYAKSNGFTFKALDAVSLATPNVTLANASNGVKVSWNKVAGATGYYVYRKASATATFAKIATITSASTVSYTDTTAVAGTSYYYTVRAYHGSTMSSYVTNKTIRRLAQPNVTLANASNGVKVSWNKVAGATGYYVYRKASATATFAKIATITNASTVSYTDTTAVAGTSYYYTVRAYYGSTMSSYETNKTIRRLAQPTVTLANASNGVKVSWNKIAGATGYYVYRKTSATATFAKIATITNSSTVSYTDTTTAAGTSYYYTVRAYYGSTMSSYVSNQSIRRLAQPTVTLATPNVTLANASNGVKVSWNQIAGATGYYVYRKTSATATFAKIATITSASTVSYIDTTAKSGTTYYYTVRAYYGSTMSSYVTNKTIRRLAQPSVTLANASNGVKVSWNKVAGATGYYVYRKASATATFVKIATITNASTVSYTDTTAKSGTTYYYTVRAYYGSTMSSYVTNKYIKR